MEEDDEDEGKRDVGTLAPVHWGVRQCPTLSFQRLQT